MRYTRGGYTVIEVTIVLAITAVLFISAVGVFSGKQNQTQFNQAMQDLDSKIQSIATKVKSGSFPNSGGYVCTVSGGRPQLSQGSSGSGTNTSCITLGNAVRTTTDSDTLYVYTVLGTRNAYSGGTDTGVPASSVKGANPEPIMGAPGQTVDLTESYKLIGGAQVVSSKVNGQGTTSDIIGLYLSPQSGSAAGQGSTFTALGYPFDSKSTGSSATLIKECIEQSTLACDTTATLGQWNLCIQNGGGGQKALLTVNSRSSGIATKITYKECA